MPISTARLILRHFTPDDYAPLRELESDPAVLRYRSRTSISPDMTQAFLQHAQQSRADDPRMFYAYAVVKQETLEWLGQCGLTVLDSDVTQAFVWYSLLPRYWSHGYMTEALHALVYAGVTEFPLNQIVAECHPQNHASMRVMQKAGLHYRGHMQRTNPAGKTEERVRYGVTRRELEHLNGTQISIEPPL